LSDINDGTITTAFFDPQYRGVLDKLQYGNEGKGRGKARSNLDQMDEDTIKQFIVQIDRVLKNSGHLFLWVDKYNLCNGVQSWLENTDLNLVDMIVWDKDKIGMGYRSRHKSEYLIVIQKSPVRAKGCWDDHSIPDVWTEKTEKIHPHSKPIELQKRLIEATTHKGDVVLDPASGGYSVYKACNELGIDFIGGDIRYGE
jgi:site-specific DNA-methyltransferase (adenine-specific)